MRIWELFFLLTLATIPVQLGKIFFVDSSYVLGIPVDYLAVTIYLSEIILFSFIFASFVFGKIKLNQNRNFLILVTAFSLYLFTSSLFSKSSQITGTIFSLNVAAFGTFSILAAHMFQKPKLEGAIKFILNFSLLWQSILIIFEFSFQRSLGLWLLGERSFDASTVNIAHADFLGLQLLRPYGTFPHPNVAAAFLLTALVIVLAQNKRKTWSLSQKIIIAVTVLAIVLTFAKTAILILLLIFLVTNKSFRLKITALAAFMIATIILFLNPAIVPVPSVAERLLLIQSSLDITLKNPLFGIGTTNFIRELASLNLFSLAQTRLLQPVHNIFLLIMAENGIIGLIFLASLLYFVSRKITTRYKFILFIVIIIYGSVDHFYWTLHQGQLLFWVSLGYILARTKRAI